jgi:hypothetical protein
MNVVDNTIEQWNSMIIAWRIKLLSSKVSDLCMLVCPKVL